MNQFVAKALEVVDETYTELIQFAEDVFNKSTHEVDNLIQNAYQEGESLSNEAIRDLMLKLSIKAYSLGEIKEKSAFKSALSEAIRKDTYARKFNESEGTAAVRENKAIVQSSENIIAEEIFTLVSNMMKTKNDEVHRVVSTLQTILMTRMQEAKLSMNEVQ